MAISRRIRCGPPTFQSLSVKPTMKRGQVTFAANKKGRPIGDPLLLVAGAGSGCKFRPIELRKDHNRYPKCFKRHGCEQV